MPKKVITATLAFAMCLSMTACGNTASTPSTQPSEQSAASQNSAAVASDAGTAPATTGWPNGKTVEIEVAAKAGGGSDLTARYMTEAWGKLIDGNFVVNNYDSEVARQMVSNAEPDGLKMIHVIASGMCNYLTGTSEVHPIDDSTVIAKMLDGGVNVIVCAPDAPYSNFAELKEYVDAHPHEVVTGVSIGGASQLLFMNLANSMGGLDLNYVQCSSESDKLTGIASKSLDLSNCSLNNAIAYAQDGKVKVLGTVGWGEDATLEQVAEMAGQELGDEYLTSVEQGYPGSAWISGTYLVGPAGMDPALVEEINASLQQIANDPAYCENVLKQGQRLKLEGVEESTQHYQELYDLMVKLTTQAGINVR